MICEEPLVMVLCVALLISEELACFVWEKLQLLLLLKQISVVFQLKYQLPCCSRVNIRLLIIQKRIFVYLIVIE